MRHTDFDFHQFHHHVFDDFNILNFDDFDAYLIFHNTIINVRCLSLVFKFAFLSFVKFQINFVEIFSIQ